MKHFDDNGQLINKKFKKTLNRVADIAREAAESFAKVSNVIELRLFRDLITSTAQLQGTLTILDKMTAKTKKRRKNKKN